MPNIPFIRKTYYVYTLAYPDGTVFYVGKGRGTRIDTHEEEAMRGIKSKRCDVIRQIWARGEQVQKDIVYGTTNEQDALAYEWTLINLVHNTPYLTNVRHNDYASEHVRNFTSPSQRRGQPRAPARPEPASNQRERWRYGRPIDSKVVAQMIGKTPRTVIRLAERGEIVGFKVGDVWRFHREDIEDYIEAREFGG